MPRSARPSLLSLVLLAAMTGPSLLGAHAATYGRLINLDRGGQDMGAPILNSNEAKCQAACDATTECKAFVLGDDTTCTLKSSLGVTSYRPGILYFTKPADQQKGDPAEQLKGRFTRITGLGYRINGRGPQNMTPEMCALACEASSSCAGYTIDTAVNGCWLFDEAKDTIAEAKYESFVKNPVGTTATLAYKGEKDITRVGGWSASRSNFTVAQCAVECAKEASCIGFAMRLDSNGCLVKGNMTGEVTPAVNLRDTYTKL